MRIPLLAATALSLSAIAFGAPHGARAEPKFDFDHTAGRLPKTVVPKAYKIDLVTNLEKLTLSGHETVQLDVRAATPDVTLNANGPVISHATLEDGSVATVTKDDEKQQLTLHFTKPVTAGAHTLTIDYTAPIIAQPAGIYYDDYKTPQGASKRMLVTQFEAADARRMFPGWDEPAYKATFELSAVVPADYTAISNMPATATTPAGNGQKKVQFGVSPRMSTYLLALVAGDLSAIKGEAPPTQLAVWAPTGEQDRGAYALKAESEILPYYNQYFGVPFPLPKLDLIAIPGNFEAGAMENWGAITFVDNTLLFDPKASDAQTKETVYLDVAHEMAHQWSGDLVTMGWWDNIWLNEGFATWMENKATDHFNPSWEIWPREHGSREQAMAQDAYPSTHAIQQVIKDESQAASAFDAISYQKGEQVIRMIEDWISPDKFRDGMRAYMKAHQYNNATSADLWAALGQASGKDVATVAASFTEQPGIPLVEVARSCSGGHGKITLTEDRFTINDPNPAKQTWTVPVTVGFIGGKTQQVMLSGAPVTVPLPSCAAAAKANWGEQGYYRVQYDAASLKPLVANYAKFGDADRANLLGDQFAMFAAGRAPLADWLNMLPALKAEKNIAPWQDTLNHLGRLDDLTRGTPAHAQFRAYIRKLLAPEFARLGWDAKPNESFLDALLRPRVIETLGRADDKAVVAEARKRFAAFVSKPESLAPNLREAVATIVGEHAGEQDYATLQKLGEQATSTEEKLRYFIAMSLSPDPKLVQRTIDFSLSGAVPNARIVFLIYGAARGSDDPDSVFRLVQANEAKIRPHLADMSQNFLLPAAAAGSMNPAIADAMLNDPSVKGSTGALVVAREAADQIRTAASLHEKASSEIASWVKGKV